MQREGKVCVGTVRVVKDVEKPESKEILAEAIVRISKGFEALQKSGLNERAIVALLYDSTKVAKGDIKTVLGALRRLSGWYCR